MPTQRAELFEFGGVDSRSNAANYPRERSLRCLNFVPQPNGSLRLRYGYSQPTMSTVSASAIHSAAYFELWSGTQYVLLGQGTSLKRLALASGTVTSLATLASGNPWGHFRANNKLFLGNGTDFKSYDGTTLRDVGIRGPNSTETSGVSVTTATSGSFSTTTLSGYQMYMAYYNPTTGHVGNRAAIGTRRTIGAANLAIVLSGLPDLSAVSAELVKAIGRTPDGGEVPYWVTDANGNLVTVGNTATVATITSATVDFASELPTRNTTPLAGLNKFAKVNGRIWAAKDGDVNLYYSEAEEDAVSGDFVGRPEEAWPANNAEAFPTAEVPAAIHGYQGEGWFFSKNHLAIYSDWLRQQVANPWRGIWLGGCAGQRAFTETPYGPYWLSGNKELMSWGDAGPVPISDEYQLALLAKIADSELANTELAYFRDPEQQIDRLVVKSKDSNGNPVLVAHDFKLRDGRSPFGQAYNYSYVGMTPNTLAGVGYTPRQPVRDTNKRERLWAGATDGRLYQLEDGTRDNGADFTGDYIGFAYIGADEPLVVGLQWTGDPEASVAFGTKLDAAGLGDLIAGAKSIVDAGVFLSEAVFNRGAKYLYSRVQITSRSGKNYNLSDPQQIPVNEYGSVLSAKLKLGQRRPEAR